MIKSKSGATPRSQVIDYSLCPKEVIEAIVKRFQYGIDHGHAKNNWRIGKDDPEFIKSRINHAFKHFLNLQDGTGTKEDLEALLCNLAMVCWWKENGNDVKEALPHLYK